MGVDIAATADGPAADNANGMVCRRWASVKEKQERRGRRRRSMVAGC